MDRTFSIHTVGCKLNQFESECIRQALVRASWEHRRFDERAAVYVINSCTVTGRSDARCRAAARRARRLAPGSLIVVAGCYAETQPGRLAGMAEVDLVVGNAEKGSLPAILEGIASGRSADESRWLAAGRTDGPAAFAPIDGFLGHARAFVKIQEGCSDSCAYCIVPLARGTSRSVAPEAVVAQIETLRASGYSEIVLTGVHIGRYGVDLSPATSLAALVELVVSRTGIPRLRLSSVEPTEVTARLLALAGGNGRVAPHFHVPLQSGDDDVLRAMNRPYRAGLFRDTVETILREVPGAAVGTDVIVGFPGETEEAFERTAALVRDLPLSYLHVFNYSPRPSTAAATMRGQVGGADKKRRGGALIDIGKRKRLAFESSQIGTVHLVVVEAPPRGAPRLSRSLTGNYCEVLIPRGAAPERSLVRVRVTRASRGKLYGELADGGGAATEREAAIES